MQPGAGTYWNVRKSAIALGSTSRGTLGSASRLFSSLANTMRRPSSCQ
jgi:hypothetical protein